jgi:hypothetical protein
MVITALDPHAMVKRQNNARHNLHEILMIALCTMLCGCEDCSDMPLFGQAKEPFLRQSPSCAASPSIWLSWKAQRVP